MQKRSIAPLITREAYPTKKPRLTGSEHEDTDTDDSIITFDTSDSLLNLVIESSPESSSSEELIRAKVRLGEEFDFRLLKLSERYDQRYLNYFSQLKHCEIRSLFRGIAHVELDWNHDNFVKEEYQTITGNPLARSCLYCGDLELIGETCVEYGEISAEDFVNKFKDHFSFCHYNCSRALFTINFDYGEIK